MGYTVFSHRKRLATDTPIRLVESSRSVRSKQLGGLLDSVRQWELQVLGQVLLNVLSLDVVGLFQFNNLQDVDVSKSGSVSGSQVLVHGFDGTNSGNVSVFLVHVVDTRSGFVSDPDTEGLDLGWSSFSNDVDGDNFTRSLLDLVQLLQEVPVTRLSHNNVRGKDSHSVQLWFRDRLGGETTTDNLILVQSRHSKTQ